MAKVTITIDDTNKAITGALGENTLETLSEMKGYQTMTTNPKYVQTLDKDTDTVSDNGESPTIDNPQTRAEFVGAKVLKEAILPYLTKEMANIEREAAELKVKQINSVIESSTVITTA